MSLESFYGGKQGVSPIVKARFKYVDTKDQAYIAKVNSGIVVDSKDVMELCFADTSYTDVWYGQLAIIDTENKSNKNNGKLFRRVLTRSNNEITDGGTPHGEYIGRIVGPSEGFPKVWLGSLKEMSNKAKVAYQENPDNHYVFPKSKNNGGAGSVFDGQGRVLASGEDSLSLKASSPDKGMIETLEGNKTNNQLIPGVKITTDEEGNKSYEYETGIHYSWVNIRNNIGGDKEDTYVYLGFQIPYTVIDLNFSGVDWTESFSSSQANRDEYLNGTQPFYQKWSIEIPRGIRGNGVGFLRQAKFSDFKNADPNNPEKTEILYRYEDIYNVNDGTFTLPEDTGNYRQAFEFDAGLNNEGSILVYTIYGYDTSYDSTNSYQKTATCYFGKMNDINGINLAEDGTLTISYSSGKDDPLENKIKWIENIEMITKDGENYNSNNPNFIKITYNVIENNGENKKTELGPLKFIDYMQWKENDNQDNRQLYVKYTDNTTVEPVSGDNIENSNSFNQIDGLRIKADTKEIQYHTNPINASLPDDDNENEGNYRSFSNPVILDIIEEAFINGEGHLLIKHSSSEIRYNGNYDDSQSYQPYTRYHHYDEEKNKHWYKGGDLPDATGGNDEQGVWWEDLGIVKQHISGLRIGEEFNTERYNYYLEQIGQSPIDDWNIANLPKPITTILTEPWDVNGVNISPYTDGHIKIYQKGQNKNINADILEDKIGQLVFFDGNAYYFDFGEKYDDDNSVDNNLRGRRWKSAGSWSTAQESLQLKIKDGPTEEDLVPSIGIIPFFKNGMVFETDWANNKENKFELIKSWQ